MSDKRNLYQRFIEKGLALNDQLAAARSILANERTFLSYQRTALTLAVAGFSFIKFFDHQLLSILGWFFLPSALITVILGIVRYVKMRDLIRNLEIVSHMEHKEEINHIISDSFDPF